MKKVLLFLLILTVLFTGCSSIPKKERVTAVTAQKEKASLYLDRGHNEYRWDSFDSAIHLYTNALTSASAVDWQEGMVRSLVHLSRANDRLGKSGVSREYLERAFDLIEDESPAELFAVVSNRKTEWLFFNSSAEEAIKESNLVLPLADNLENEEAGETWRIRASILKSMKSYDPALESVSKALDLDEKGNYIAEIASDYYIMASIYSLKGNYEKAAESMESALKNDKFIENTPGIAQDLYAFGLIYEKSGDMDKAYRYYNRSYLVYKAISRNTIPGNLQQKMDKSPSGDLWQKVADVF